MSLENIKEMSTSDLNIFSNRLSVYNSALVEQRKHILSIYSQKKLPDYDFNPLLDLVSKEINDISLVMEAMSNEINSRMTEMIGFSPKLKELSAAFMDFSEKLKTTNTDSQFFKNDINA